MVMKDAIITIYFFITFLILAWCNSFGARDLWALLCRFIISKFNQTQTMCASFGLSSLSHLEYNVICLIIKLKPTIILPRSFDNHFGNK